MTMLDNVPTGPSLRPERAEADKSVLSAAVREAKPIVPVRPLRRAMRVWQLKRRSEHRWAAVVLAVSTAIVVALVALRGLGGLPQLAHQGLSPSGSPAWRLVSDLQASPWQTLPNGGHEIGPPSLICPTSSTCYSTGLVTVGTTNVFTIEVTHDSGSSWQQSTLPVRFSELPSLACRDADICALFGFAGSINAGDSTSAGVVTFSHPTFVETTNGGRTWFARPGPSSAAGNWVTSVACTTATSCLVVSSGGRFAEGVAAVTHNGGATWSTSDLPANFIPTFLQCSSASSCVASGTVSPGGTPGFGPGAIFYTTDGGATWTAAAVPPNLADIASLSCGPNGNCMAIFSSGVVGTGTTVLSSTDAGRTWEVAPATGLPSASVTSLSCADGTYCWASGIRRPLASPGGSSGIDDNYFAASTSDRGTTWDVVPYPPNVGAVMVLSCPSASRCYALAPSQPGMVGVLRYGPQARGGS